MCSRAFQLLIQFLQVWIGERWSVGGEECKLKCQRKFPALKLVSENHAGIVDSIVKAGHCPVVIRMYWALVA